MSRVHKAASLKRDRPRRIGSRRLMAIDLFSGCGGLTLGLKLAGFRVAAAVEMSKLAVETYRENHPEVLVWQKDIRSVRASEIMCQISLKPGELDLLAGCPPCQGFSSLRTLNGGRRVLDPRNDLILQFLRFVRVLKPKAVMMENVPGLIRTRRFRHLADRLRRMGYAYNCGVLDAADYGVPQRRRRMILLASRKAAPPFALPRKNGKTLRQAIFDLADTTSS